MFMIVHSKEFNAPLLIVSEQGFEEDMKKRKAYLTFWDTIEHGRKISSLESISCHKKKMLDGIYFCCSIISSETDTAGRRLPYIFCFKKGDRFEIFSQHLETLAAANYTLTRGEFEIVRNFAEELQKKNLFLDILKRIWNIIIRIIKK